MKEKEEEKSCGELFGRPIVPCDDLNLKDKDIVVGDLDDLHEDMINREPPDD
jgi:hypothetical protein